MIPIIIIMVAAFTMGTESPDLSLTRPAEIFLSAG